MEDDRKKIRNGRRPQKKWDDLKTKQKTLPKKNERRPPPPKNGGRPRKK
jgi:hypothetical protein